MVNRIPLKDRTRSDGMAWCEFHQTIFYDPKKYNQCYHCYLEWKKEQNKKFGSGPEDTVL